LLRACALQYGKSWDKSLSYAEFSYNNRYQESLKMVPNEMLYGLRCRTPFFLVKVENGRFLDPTFYKGPRSGFVWLGKTYELRNEGIRAMPIIVEDN
jgi:hypothetical protein